MKTARFSLSAQILLWCALLSACASLPNTSADTVDGRRVEYLVSRHHGPTVVFENGLGGTLDWWAKVWPEAAKDASALAYNRPGYGRSDAVDTPRDGDHVVAELRELLKVQKLDPPYVLVGHSLGGLYMQLFARQYPDEVQALILVDSTHPEQLRGKGAQSQWPAWVRVGFNLMSSDVAKQELHALDATGQRVLGLPAPTGVRVWVLSALRPMQERSALADDANEKRIALAALYPGAKQIWVDSGHGIPLEKGARPVSWRWSMSKRYRMREPFDEGTERSARREVELNAGLSGLMWGYGALAIYPHLREVAQIAYPMLLAGSAGVAALYAPLAGRAYLYMIVPQVASLVAAHLAFDGLRSIGLAATRAGEWKASDPEEVSRWFLDRVTEHTEQLRRVCRYLKAWRDRHWKAGDGPTSVCIMIAVAQSFEPQRGRDDLALERAARVLATALKGEVREQAIADGAEDFNKRLDAAGRQAASSLAETLADQLRAARFKASYLAGDAIELVRRQLGERVPYRPDLVEPDGGEDAVRLVGAERVARPVVKSTSAG